MSETQDLIEGNGTRPVIGGPVGHSTLVSNKQWIVIQVSCSAHRQMVEDGDCNEITILLH